MTDTRPTVLVLLGCFSRGVEATGPNQSLIGMAEALSHRYRFRVLADAVPGDRPGEWTRLAGIEQMPLQRGRLGVRGLARAIRATPHDLIITNSVFDTWFSARMLLLRRLGRIPHRPVLLAPRGELDPGALQIGHRRKAIHLAMMKRLGLLSRGVTLQATAETEAANIRAALGPDIPVCITPNIRSVAPLPPHQPRKPGEKLRIAYLSRIDRKKNLDFALERVREAGVPARFRIFGPISQESYWARCQELIARMPPQVEVIYEGAIPQSEVAAAIAGNDLFFLPTSAENYGHAIVDAMMAGTPVLISDQTPWRDLSEAGAGWDIPLSEPHRFTQVLRTLSQDANEAARLRATTRAFAERRIGSDENARSLADCLDGLVAQGRKVGAMLTPRTAGGMTAP